MSRSDSSRDEAAKQLAQVLPPAALDALLADAEASGTPIDGPDGLLAQITKSVLERALDVEIADHLGYEHGDPAGNGSGNSRNGHGRKTVLTTAGPVDLEVPRDRNGTFDPVIVPKRKRRLGQVEDMILSLYARGMSTRDITEHLAEVYGASVSAATVSRVTEVVADEIAAWQSRPVDPVYPILYIDAIRLKIRDGGVVSNKAAHVVIGVDVEGIKQVLGVWIQQTEGAKFWHGVLTELRNRGCRDALFVCCDGLAGLPESIAAVWPVRRGDPAGACDLLGPPGDRLADRGRAAVGRYRGAVPFPAGGPEVGVRTGPCRAVLGRRPPDAILRPPPVRRAWGPAS
ncbi:IS256 family transposase, partial [Mycobacterium avium]|uniref:IS256 family transposase n=1 Tax=Mycobacterium avium TaxID=1764 RepID=UPI000B2D4406